MKNYFNKYFANELTSDERADFLIKVGSDEELKEEFVENQNLLALIDWTFPRKQDEEEVVQQKLDEFKRKMKQRPNE